MNYQFIRDLNGHPVAEFDMGSEAFSRWFSEELQSDALKIAQIFAAISQLQSQQIKQYRLKGNEFDLALDPDEVEVRSRDLDIDGPEELPEGTELYDQEFIAGCGLEDFIGVLNSWRDFVTEK